MGYPTINDFDRNIITRTIENLDGTVQNTFTHLLNSLLGLIVLPRQWNSQGRRKIEYLNKPLSDFREVIFFNDNTHYTDDDGNEVEIKVLELKPDESTTITLKKIIDKLRHSIAHQAIRPTKEGDTWKGVIFRNYTNDNSTSSWNDDYNFQLYLTQTELEIFAKFIATKYLEDINSE
jgi:hypothetical protein